MCSYSVMMDYGQKRWNELQPPSLIRTYPPFDPSSQTVAFVAASKEDLEALKKEWAEFKELVQAAIKFDIATGQPSCEDPKKVEWMDAMEQRMSTLEWANQPTMPPPQLSPEQTNALIKAAGFLEDLNGLLGTARSKTESICEDLYREFPEVFP